MSAGTTPTQVWDLPLRLFHWLIALNLLGSWVFAEAGFDYFQYHIYCGYSALVLLGFRIAWGFIGPKHARFRNFVRGPSAVARDLSTLLTPQPSTAVGHTASGGWSVMLMLLLIGIQVGTGFFISDDIFYAGPYNPVVSSDTAGQLANIHHLNFTVLQITVVLHIVTVVWYGKRKKSPLIRAMITGVKQLPSGIADAQRVASRPMLAFVIIVAMGLAVWALVALAPPPAMLF